MTHVTDDCQCQMCLQANVCLGTQFEAREIYDCVLLPVNVHGPDQSVLYYTILYNTLLYYSVLRKNVLQTNKQIKLYTLVI